MRDSFFWRNPVQQEVVFSLLEQAPFGMRSRILDVGASTGENVLSYALMYLETYGRNWHNRAFFETVDNREAITELFRRGVFIDESVEHLPEKYLKYFSKSIMYRHPKDYDKPLHLYLFKQEFLDYIQIYCMDFADYPKKGKKQDLIFLQNIPCHFNDPTLEETFIKKAHKLLLPGGYLVCGGRSEQAGEVLKTLGFIPVVEKMREIWNSWKGFTPWAKPCFIEGKEDPFFISSIFRKAE